MILLDTSVWVDHLRSTEKGVLENLNANNVVMHPMIVGELACGNLPNREEFLWKMNALPQINEVAHQEVISFIESAALVGRGIGFIDAHLLCSVMSNAGTSVWTRDRHLRSIAEEIGVAYPECA